MIFNNSAFLARRPVAHSMFCITLISGSIRWADIETLFMGLGGEVTERAGSRVAVVLFDEVSVFHRPHPQPTTDKSAVASIRK